MPCLTASNLCQLNGCCWQLTMTTLWWGWRHQAQWACGRYLHALSFHFCNCETIHHLRAQTIPSAGTLSLPALHTHTVCGAPCWLFKSSSDLARKLRLMERVLRVSLIHFRGWHTSSFHTLLHRSIRCPAEPHIQAGYLPDIRVSQVIFMTRASKLSRLFFFHLMTSVLKKRCCWEETIIVPARILI